MRELLSERILVISAPPPCPSFPWSFWKYQGKPQKHQGFISPREPLKPWKISRKHPKRPRNFSEIPPVLLGIPWRALRGPLRNQFWKKRRPQPYWGGENSGNALEASNALNYRLFSGRLFFFCQDSGPAGRGRTKNVKKWSNKCHDSVNREVQTVNWEAGKEGAVETGVKTSLKIRQEQHLIESSSKSGCAYQTL